MDKSWATDLCIPKYLILMFYFHFSRGSFSDNENLKGGPVILILDPDGSD